MAEQITLPVKKAPLKEQLEASSTAVVSDLI